MYVGTEWGHVDGLPGAVLRRLWLDGSWADGTDEQEDELDDVAKGKLNPPTNTEGPGGVVERNNRGRGLQSEDEDNALVEHIEERGQAAADEGGEPKKSDEDLRIEELARKVGVRLP